MENNYTPLTGFKGLDKNLATSKSGGDIETFQVGRIYYKENIENPKLCSDQGYHFAQTLEDCFTYYPNNGSNRFFNIEVLGNFTHGKPSDKKSITTAFRLVSEITPEEIEKKKKEQLKKKIEKSFNLESIQLLQTQNPYCFVGGSTGLFLHGLSLKRWEHSTKDIDIITPFFFQWTSTKDVDIDMDEEKTSGNDYNHTFLVNGSKMDVRIDNQQKYEIINYDGFNYKVALIEDILEAKLRYAREKNGEKHKMDIFELINYKQK